MSLNSIIEQQTEFQKTVDSLRESVMMVKTVVSPAPFDITEHLMTDRQVAKRMTAVSIMKAPIPNPKDPENPTYPTEEEAMERAHMVVYGKKLYDGNGKLIDDEEKHPECIDYKKMTSGTENSEIKKTIKEKKEKIKESVKMLQIKSSELIQDSTIFATSLVMIAPSVLAIGNAIVSTLNIFMNLINKLTEILPFLQPLTDIFMFVKMEQLNFVVGSITTILKVLNTPIELIKQALEQIKGFLSGNLPGIPSIAGVSIADVVPGLPKSISDIPGIGEVTKIFGL